MALGRDGSYSDVFWIFRGSGSLVRTTAEDMEWVSLRCSVVGVREFGCVVLCRVVFALL